MTMKKVLMVAGEASADKHAAAVIRSLKSVIPDVEIFGMGGPEMESAGLECCYGMDEFSVMGFSDVLPRLLRIFQVYKGITDLIRERRPDIVVPVDLPDFNMRIAHAAKKHRTKVLYYIAPQAWAWRRGRARTLSAITDGLAVIFPFEEDFFRSYGVNARYVGHPLLENPRDPFAVTWPPQKIALLPGSRYHEIKRLLPIMLGAKRIVQERYPDITWHLPVAPGLDATILKEMADTDVVVSDTLSRVDLAMVKSGTSSFEMAILGIPEIICYETSTFNYLLARAFVKLEHIGMPNIILGKTVVEELIQDNLTEESLARALMGIIEDKARHDVLLDAYSKIRDIMGSLKTSQGVAHWIHSMIQ
jgi:lipid-A-disaccharide synthase